MARCIGSFNVSRIETCQPGQPSPVGVWQDFSRLDQKSVPSTPEWGRAYSPAEDRLPFWLSVRVVKCLNLSLLLRNLKKLKKAKNNAKKTNIPLFEKSKNKSKTKPNDYFQKANKSKRKQKTNWIYIHMRLLFFLFFGTLFLFFDCFFVFFSFSGDLMTGTFEHVKKLVEKAKKTKTKRTKTKQVEESETKAKQDRTKSENKWFVFLKQIRLGLFFLFFLIEVWIRFCFFSSFYFQSFYISYL